MKLGKAGRYGMVLAALSLALLTTHPIWLRLIALPLAQLDELPTAMANAPKNILFTQAAWRVLPAYEFASEQASQSPDFRILILDSYQGPTEQLGATMPFAENAFRRLQQQGLPDSQLITIGDRTAFTDVDKFKAAQAWLDAHPTESLIIPASRLSGGLLQAVADDVLTQEQRKRIFILGFRYRGIDESNWWKSSTGLKSLIAEYLAFTHYGLFGNKGRTDHWDPDDYERELAKLPGARPRKKTEPEEPSPPDASPHGEPAELNSETSS